MLKYLPIVKKVCTFPNLHYSNLRAMTKLCFIQISPIHLVCIARLLFFFCESKGLLVGNVEPYSAIFTRTYCTKKKNKPSGLRSGYTRLKVTIPSVLALVSSAWTLWLAKAIASDEIDDNNSPLGSGKPYLFLRYFNNDMWMRIPPHQDQVAKPITKLIHLL